MRKNYENIRGGVFSGTEIRKSFEISEITERIRSLSGGAEFLWSVHLDRDDGAKYRTFEESFEALGTGKDLSVNFRLPDGSVEGYAFSKTGPDSAKLISIAIS